MKMKMSFCGTRSLADVTYNTASFPSLIRTLQTLIRSGDLDANKKSPLVLLGYKERDASERLLWEMAADIGIIFAKVGEKEGAGGNAVEIWLGRVSTIPSKRSGYQSTDSDHRHTDYVVVRRMIAIRASCSSRAYANLTCGLAWLSTTRLLESV